MNRLKEGHRLAQIGSPATGAGGHRIGGPAPVAHDPVSRSLTPKCILRILACMEHARVRPAESGLPLCPTVMTCPLCARPLEPIPDREDYRYARCVECGRVYLLEAVPQPGAGTLPSSPRAA